MNIITELLRYIIIIIIGIVLSNWYERKKGSEHQFKTSLFFILCWRTGVFLIVITMNLMFDLFLSNSFLITYYYVIHPIILLIITFIINIILGMEFFKLFYHQKTQEFTVIILIIVIIDMILESVFFYIILIPETLVANFNL